MRKFLSIFAALLIAIAVNAGEVAVSEGNNTLRAALNSAESGSVLVLGAGTYTDDNYIEFTKDVEVKAAADALTTPVIKIGTYIKVSGGAKVKISGIKIDGTDQSSRDQIFRVYTGANSLVIENCEFTAGKKPMFRVESGNNLDSLILRNCKFIDNVGKIISNEGTIGRIELQDCEIKGNSDIVIKGASTSHADSCIVNNCFFHNNAKQAIFFDASGTDSKETCDKLVVTNSTFANTAAQSDWISIVEARPYSTASSTNSDAIKVIVDHCTFYNNPCVDSGHANIRTHYLTDVSVSNSIFMNPTELAQRAIYCDTGGSVSNCLTFNFTKDPSRFGISYGCTISGCAAGDPLFADAPNNDFTLDESSPAVDAGTDGKTLGDPRWWPVIVLPETDFSEPFVCRPAKAKLSGRIVLAKSVDGDTLKWNNNSDATQNGIARWKFHATKGCYVTAKVFVNAKNTTGHLFNVTLLDENADAIDGPIAEPSDSWGAVAVDIPGDLLVPRAGDYIIQLTNPNTDGWSTTPVDSLMLSYKDEAPVYYLKGIWNDDAVSSVKQMECVGREDFILENVVLRGEGVNYSTDPAFSGGGWAPASGFLGEQPASLDTLTLEFNSTTQDITCTILGKYVPPTYAIAKADMAYGAITVEGDITESEAGETIKLYINPFQYYELDELSVEGGSGPVIVTIDATTKKEATFVMPAEAVTISATFKLVKHTVTFAAAGAEGIIPDAIHVTHGESVTIPVNKTLFIEGKTLTKWNDGTADHAIGSTFTPDQDTILYAVFEDNVIDILDLPTDLEIKWEFGESKGAPSVHFESGVGIGLLVTQAIVGGARVDVKLDIDATAGKFYNKGRGDNWAQVNSGTLFQFPSKAGAAVQVKTYNDPEYSLLDGETYSGSWVSKLANYTAAPTSGVSTFTVKDGEYYEYLQVTLPAKKFAVSIVTGIEHGTVVASPTSAKAGDIITLTITPDEDYRLMSLDVLGVDAGDIDIDLAGTSATFPMPAANVEVSASFVYEKYAITIDPAIEHGTVSAGVAEAKAGVDITLTITPEDGYELETLTVTKTASGDLIDVVANVFAMPGEAVTVSATFKLSKMSLTQFVADKPATEVTLKDLTVITSVFTGKNDKNINIYVVDEDGVALVLFDANKANYTSLLTAGKVLSGQKAVYGNYNNQDQIVPKNAVTPTDGTAPVPTLMAVADVTKNDTNTYIRLENVEVIKSGNNYYWEKAAGDKDIQMYGITTAYNPTKEGNYNFEGLLVNFKGTQLELVVTNIEALDPPTPPYDPEGEGTEAKPYTVADVIGLAVASGTEDVWVQGFVMGAWRFDKVFRNDSVLSNIVLADAADEADLAKMIAVELPNKSTVRAGLNLTDNAYLIGQQISVLGKLQSYFSVPGVKGTSNFKKPEKPTAIDNAAPEQKAMKMIENGQLFIIKNGKKYNALGELVK